MQAERWLIRSRFGDDSSQRRCHLEGVRAVLLPRKIHGDCVADPFGIIVLSVKSGGSA